MFLTNVRPGQLKNRASISTRHAINPKMIYASVGFGLEGDERDKPGFDTAAFWADRHWLDDDAQGASRCRCLAVGDYITGIGTASGILAALLRAQKTGKGTLVQFPRAVGAYVVGSDFSTFMRYGRIARSPAP